MDVESAIFSQDSEQNKKSDGHNHNHTNGMSNGYSGGENKHHKSSHKDKHRDKDRDHKKDHKTSSSKDKERDREKDRDKHSSSKDKDRSKDKDSSKSSRDKDREKDRSDRDKEKCRDKHHHDDKKSSSSSSSKHKSDKSSSKDSKSKDHNSKSSSSNSDKHKHSSSSSKDKHSSSSSKDKDRSKSESSKDKHHSSSSRDKDRKDRDKEREKSRSDKSKSNHSSSNHYRENSESNRDDKIIQKDAIKVEDDYKQENEYVSSSDQVDEPNASSASSSFYNLSAFDNTQQDDSCDNTEDTKDDVSIKQEPDDDYLSDDAPLASRKSTKRKVVESDEEDDIPLSARKKVKSEKKKSKKRYNEEKDNDEYEEKPKPVKIKKEIKREPETGSPKKRKKKEEAEPEVWKWWEEEKKDDGTKWNFLEHKGPVFAPPYEPLPDNVRFYYDNKEMKLSQDAEEVAGFYARMLDHDYTTKDIFNNNFFKDWRKTMTEKERSKITDLKKCNFKEMHAFFMDQAEKNRNRTKEEKEELKKKNAAIQEEYGFCTIDGHKEKIGNFKIEPPGLFRGRGEHPKMGMLKKRVMPEDVLINCAKKSKIPEPPPGHKWKEVRHDPSVTWLASWTENVQNQVKYVMLNPSSKLKGEKDWQKYETARKLAKSIDKIRKEYREDWKSKEMRIRQRAVALYFIDRLALRAGNEKDEDQADTVGCCSLRVEHIDLHEEKDGKEYVVVFDFLGKDSIRYYNELPVEKRVFKNLQLFMENKSPSDDLFDRLNTAVLNKHLNELMEGLTAKVFRTYNASWTLQQQLEELTNPDDSVAEKILSYNRANRAVAILCNHQRSVPKGHAKSMEKLKEKIQQKREQIDDAEVQVKDAKRAAKSSVKEQVIYDKKKKMLERLRDQLKKLEVQETDRDENKAIALGTSKLNYLDPRISVAWCKKFDVPIEKIYNKTQRDKFRWAIDMAGADYVF